METFIVDTVKMVEIETTIMLVEALGLNLNPIETRTHPKGS
jgi:hypothetical protein